MGGSGYNGHGAGGRWGRVSLDHLGDTGNDVPPGGAGRSVHHDDFRVEHRAGVGQRSADAAAEVMQQPSHAGITVRGHRHHPRVRQWLVVCGLRGVEQPGSDPVNQAAAPAARAQRTVIVDLDVGEFAGESGDATVQPAVDDQASSDAVLAELDIDETVPASPGAELVFAERSEIRVVLDQYPDAGRVGQRGRRVVA